MDYPWWTIDAAEYGLREEDEIRCLACAELNGKALGRELTDFETNRGWRRQLPVLRPKLASG